jgi:anti-sigma B factor antagonist
MPYAPPDFDVAAAVNGSIAHVVISGELDNSSAPRLISMVHEIAGPPVHRVELDCKGVTFLDSAGVRALIVTRNAAAQMGIDVVLVQPSPPVTRVIEMTGLVGLLTGEQGS